MHCKIARGQVIGKVVEWCNGRVRKEVRPGQSLLCVERGV